MMTFKDVPARHWWNGRVCTTKAYRKLLNLIGKTIKEGGSVEMSTREDHSNFGKQGHVVEYVSGTITPANKIETSQAHAGGECS